MLSESFPGLDMLLPPVTHVHACAQATRDWRARIREIGLLAHHDEMMNSPLVHVSTIRVRMTSSCAWARMCSIRTRTRTGARALRLSSMCPKNSTECAPRRAAQGHKALCSRAAQGLPPLCSTRGAATGGLCSRPAPCALPPPQRTRPPGLGASPSAGQSGGRSSSALWSSAALGSLELRSSAAPPGVSPAPPPAPPGHLQHGACPEGPVWLDLTTRGTRHGASVSRSE